MTPNLSAFLRVVRACEGTAGPDGYRTLFGGGLFDSFADHPRIVVERGRYLSTAAGAYQILSRTWDWFISKNGPHDFSPDNQDLCARWLITQRKAMGDVEAGRFNDAIAKCAKEWASLPGSPYGQPVRTIEYCRRVYVEHGGAFVQESPLSTVREQPPIVNKPTETKPVDPISLVGILASVFAPLLRAKVEKAVGTEVGKPLMDNLLSKAQELTGKADPLEAVAVARNDPAVVAKLEESATDWFAQVAPMMDKLAAMEEREYAMSEDSQDRAAARYKGAEFDPARLLTYFAIGASAALTLMLGAWITISKFQASPVGIEEWAAFTGLIGWLTAKAGSIYDNRFGTTRQSAAKDVIIGEMARRR